VMGVAGLVAGFFLPRSIGSTEPAASRP